MRLRRSTIRLRIAGSVSLRAMSTSVAGIPLRGERVDDPQLHVPVLRRAVDVRQQLLLLGAAEHLQVHQRLSCRSGSGALRHRRQDLLALFGDLLWLTTNRARFLRRTDCWPLIIFSSMGSACSASVLSRLFRASSFSSSSGVAAGRHRLAHRALHLELEGEGLLEPAAVGEVLLDLLQRLQSGLHGLDLVLGERLPVERAVCLQALERGSLRERLEGLLVAGGVERRGALRVEFQLALGLA